jgi:AcrR family transcriptional regulator
VSRRTFYEQFSDKEDCFVACIDIGAETLLSAISLTTDSEITATERLDAVLATYLGLLAREPAFAKAYLVETIAAGPRAMERRRELLGRFTVLLESLHRQAVDEAVVPPGWSPDYGLVAAAISSTVTMCVAAGETRQLPAMRDRLARFVLASMGAPNARTARTARTGQES